MSNLLDKASIILTPTAYNNGEALCVKPSDGSGDFQFSRNSAATRVNAQGLVENVQILSSNLVQNGDFSEEGSEEVSNGSFSQEGVELVTNGDFATDTNWLGVNSDGVTISNGSLNYLNTPYAKQIIQTNVTTIGKTYKVTYTISNFVEGSIRLALGGNTTALRNANGTYTDYVTASVNNHLTFVVLGSPTTLSIDNVSVREVGQDWTLGTGWSIAEDKAVCIGNSGHTTLTQNNSFLLGKTYKVTFDIVVDSGNFKIQLLGGGADSGNIISSTQVGYTEYISPTANRSSFGIRSNDGNGIGSITNISVKEVGQNWVLNGDAQIIDNGCRIYSPAGAYSAATQLSLLTIGKTYKLSIDITENNGGLIRVSDGTTVLLDNISAVNTYTKYFTATDARIWVYRNGITDISITNISAIEVTDDTNLPRINYEGFSYQDALGSELITNGSFDTDSNWTTLGGWNISDGSANCNGGSIMFTNGSIAANKTYKVTYTVSEFVSGGVKVRLNGTPDTDGLVRTSNGTYTEYITSSSSVNGNFSLAAVVSFTGSIDNVSVKEYLGQEVVPESGCGSWLWESQSTNLVTYSEDFSQWSVGGTAPTLTSGQLSPSGEYNATKISGTIGSSILFIVGTSSETATRSVYAKSVSGTGTARLMSFNGNTNNLFTLTEEWQRFELTGAVPTGGNNFYFDFRDGLQTLSEYIIWGAQSEELTYATSYIPTEGSTVTRNQDVCTNGGTGTGLINSTEGTLYFEAASFVNSGTDRAISLIKDNPNTIAVFYYAAINTIRVIILDNGSTQVQMDFVLTDVTDFNKIAIKFKENDVAIWINGIERGTDTNCTIPTGLNSVDFKYSNGTNFYGKTKALAVWKEALSDQELTELTTI